MEWQRYLYGVLASASASAALLLLLAFILRTWITERLRASVKHEYDDKLETLKSALKTQSDAHLSQIKAEVDRQADKLRIAAASFSDVQKATISRKIEAVDHIWEAVRKARAVIPGAVMIADVMTPDELMNLELNAETRHLHQMLREMNPREVTPQIFRDADIARPHVGEYVWSLYCAYFGIITRCIFLLRGDIAGGDRRWFLDPGVKNMVQSAFGSEARVEFESLPYQRLGWLQSRFERDLFAAFERLLTGKSFSDAALAQALEVEKLVSAISADQIRASRSSP
jgi:hypothetical protein